MAAWSSQAQVVAGVGAEDAGPRPADRGAGSWDVSSPESSVSNSGLAASAREVSLSLGLSGLYRCVSQGLAPNQATLMELLCDLCCSST